MAHNSNMSLQKERKRVRLRTRLTVFILIVILVQLTTSVMALVLGGEFRELEAHSYNVVTEKTKSRSEYLQSDLNEKAALVQSYADRLNSVTDSILAGRRRSAADLAHDMELVERILSSSVDTVSALLRRTGANDAYFLLDTGELYAEEGGSGALAALYIRNAASSTEGDDFQLVLGQHSITYEHDGISEHYGWSRFFVPDEAREQDFDFFFAPLKAARENSGLAQSDLGYWSGFSTVSSTVTPSIKYSLPLISADGTAIGVLGIGLTEETVLSTIPSGDFAGNAGCYVLGQGSTESGFDILTYSGSAFYSLLGGAETLSVSGEKTEGIYDFKMVKDVEISGSVQQI